MRSLHRLTVGLFSRSNCDGQTDSGTLDDTRLWLHRD